jgi:predicted RNase H-like HicB family nuclease
MKRFDPFDGYTINVFLDDDGEYLAHFVELPNISAFGESPEDALRELQTAWEGVKESYQKHGEPVPVAPARKEYSGQFNVRIDRRVHRARYRGCQGRGLVKCHCFPETCQIHMVTINKGLVTHFIAVTFGTFIPRNTQYPEHRDEPYALHKVTKVPTYSPHIRVSSVPKEFIRSGGTHPNHPSQRD